MTEATLPKDVSLEAVGNAVRRIIRIIVDSGTSYVEIADTIQRRLGKPVSPDSIRKFVGRVEGGVHASETLLTLYDYIQATRTSFSPFVRECIVLHTDIFLTRDFSDSDGLRDVQPDQNKQLDWQKQIERKETYDFFVANAYRLFSRMLHVQPAESRRAAIQIEGVYAAFRASSRFTKDKRIVVSRVAIGVKHNDKEATEFRHMNANNLGDQRLSDGFIVALMGNVFMIGDVEFGHGLEMMMFRRPPAQEVKRLVGLTLTLDTNGYPVTTKIILVRMNSDPRAIEPDFRIGPDDVEQVVQEMSKLGVKDFKGQVLDHLAERAEALEGL